MTRRQATVLIVLGAVVVGLAVLGTRARRDEARRCALDGSAISPLSRVVVVDGSGTEQEFCSVRCACLWLGRSGEKPERIFVTDEATGRLIPASEAYFVRSQVRSGPAGDDRLHAFQDRYTAERNARVGFGRVLGTDERPFAQHP